VYDPVWSFREEPRESLILRTVALRSPICSSPPAAHPSPARDAAGLGPQGPAVSLSSPCGEAPVRPLAGTATCLHCVKQLKKRGILCTCFFSHSCCFRCTCNNNSCLPVPKQYRVRVSELQVLADSVKAGEVPLACLQKEAKVWISEMKKHLRMTGPKKGSAKMPVLKTSMMKDEFDEGVIVDE
ncbi:hypothetical protein BDDG_09760, partial [Blastomyces dermatitidis ATCC 18188]